MPFWPKDALARVKHLREELGYTHEACAAYLGLKSNGQYSRRETGETDFTFEEMARLCQGLFKAPVLFPHVSLREAYEFQNWKRSGGLMAAEPQIPEQLVAYSQRRGPFTDAVLLEMASRIRLDRPWDDTDLDLVRVVAERHLPPRQPGAPPAPPSKASPGQSAPPRRPRRGGAGGR